LWGTSFSGGHVIVVAAADPMIGAAVAQVPSVDGFATARLLGPWTVARLSLAAWRDVARQLFGRDPYYVPLVAEPTRLSALELPGAEKGYRSLLGRDFDEANRIAARAFLRLPLYRPIRHARHVRCPLLIQFAQTDQLTPAAGARRAAALAPRGTFQEIPGGHFDVYRGASFKIAVSAQVDFFRTHVGVDSTDRGDGRPTAS
jgi:uncharacterized protein